MAPIPHSISIKQHAGSTEDEIANEPDWGAGHNHRIGFRNKQDRLPGLTNDRDEEEEEEFEQAAKRSKLELSHREDRGDLVNFQDVLKALPDFHRRRPGVHPAGWRYVLDTTEDEIKNATAWPANIKKREKEKEKDVDKKEKQDENGEKSKDEKKPKLEHEWKRENGANQHHDAYAVRQKDDEKDADQNEESKSNMKNSGTENGDGLKEEEEEQEGENDHDKNSDEEGKDKTEYEKLLGTYSPQEIALLRALRHEQIYIRNLKQSDGTVRSPVAKVKKFISIDKADQFTPDNWIPRSDDLIRLTGKHPLNGEPKLEPLFDAGLITPNHLHYVRNHGAVPHLLWEKHILDINDGKLKLSMDDLNKNFEAINIAVALACDGNRRKELNLIRRSKGFNWGPGAVSCAYWKGPQLRDVLLAAGSTGNSRTSIKRWVNFEGADEPSEGRYATCLPLEYVMDTTNDVILAYEMNNLPLPPDHGYPVRLVVPGYVGGRSVKWVSRIWISDHENDSYYHIWDNRVLPSFITDKDGIFAETMFRHPDTACNEQNLNSVIVRPAQGESIPLSKARRGHTYRIEGYAYDGGGHEVQRVEVSLDGGDSWLYCIRKFPDAPVRHGKKFWTWLHWHLHVDITHLLRAKSIMVRCFNVFKNTQPEHPVWNVMGMMNNAWYTVRPSIETSKNDEGADTLIMFKHPTSPGTSDAGWMQPSTELQIANAKQSASSPSKQFTREEIEKHNGEQDCWLVIDGKVYDATSVLDWHPGGKAALLGHAGKVHQETTDEFESVHDDYAWNKLKECALGVITGKAQQFIKKNAEAAAKEKEKSANADDQIVLMKHRWLPARLVRRDNISKDTRRYRFSVCSSSGATKLGLETCQHLQIGCHFRDRLVVRSYTPTEPISMASQRLERRLNLKAYAEGIEQNDDGDDLSSGEESTSRSASPSSSTSSQSTNEISTENMDDLQFERENEGQLDEKGIEFTLVVKTYFPTDEQPGGTISSILDALPLGAEVEVRGPTGDICYRGNGLFEVDGKEIRFKRVSLVLGGSGITPGYQLIKRILDAKDSDETELRIVDANKSENDILLKDELNELVEGSKGKCRILHVLSHPSDAWKGAKGHIDSDIIKENLFKPDAQSVVFLCGPPAMIQKAALPALRDWGYKEDENCFGF